MKVVYLAGKYRAPTVHGIVENIREAERHALELWRMGAAVLSPHRNTALWDGALPDEVWLAGDIAMMLRCDALVLMPGWLESRGAQAEYTVFRKTKRPVFELENAADVADLKAYLRVRLMNITEFRHRLKEARNAAGLSQADLAERAEISERAIRYIEKGRYLPYFHTADKLAVVLGVSLDWLAGRE